MLWCWIASAVEAVYGAVMDAARYVLMVFAFFAALFLLVTFLGGIAGGVWFLVTHWKG